MIIPTGVKEAELPHEAKKEPEAELHHGPVEEILTDIEENPKGHILVMATGEADLHQSTLSEDIQRTRPLMKGMIYTLGPSALLIVSARSLNTTPSFFASSPKNHVHCVHG